jgi:hypothetical protein
MLSSPGMQQLPHLDQTALMANCLSLRLSNLLCRACLFRKKTCCHSSSQQLTQQADEGDYDAMADCDAMVDKDDCNENNNETENRAREQFQSQKRIFLINFFQSTKILSKKPVLCLLHFKSSRVDCQIWSTSARKHPERRKKSN